MSEDFRGTPLVRTAVSRNAIGELHYIFASWKNIVASINDGHVRSNTKIQPQVVMKDANNPPAKRKSPFRWLCNGSGMKRRFQPPLSLWKPQGRTRYRYCQKKAALPLERRCLKIRLTDRECGQNSCRCASSEATEEIKESRLST